MFRDTEYNCFPDTEVESQEVEVQLYDEKGVVDEDLKRCLKEVFGENYTERYTGIHETASVLTISTSEFEKMLVR